MQDESLKKKVARNLEVSNHIVKNNHKNYFYYYFALKNDLKESKIFVKNSSFTSKMIKLQREVKLIDE